jgi:hypothetical protein
MLADGPVLATARVSRIDIAPQSFRTSSYCFAARACADAIASMLNCRGENSSALLF